MCEKHDSVRNMIYPLLLEGVVVPTIWGGKKLYQNYKKGSSDIFIGEMWELSVRSDRRCRIANGPCKGQTLEDYIARCGNDIVYDGYDGAHFPLLIKFIDATDRLSVQVHPDDEYASTNENSVGKNELWYIVSAEPDAEIVYGLKSQYTRNQIEQAIKSGRLDAMLNKVKVRPGDIFYVPAGLVHAIGSGILIAEIQQNSDLTYRMYDYGRKDATGNKRELHIDHALNSIKHYNSAEIIKMQFEYADKPIDSSTLADNRYFKIHKMANESVDVNSEHLFHVLLCVDGDGHILFNDSSYNISAGDCWFVPAKCNTYTLTGNFKILKISPQIKKQEA